MVCKKCGCEIIPGAKFCGECGALIEYDHKVCIHCGAELPIEATFCGHCGRSLQQESAKQNEATKNISSEDSGKILIGKKLLAMIIAVVVVIIVVVACIGMNSHNDSKTESTNSQQEESQDDNSNTVDEATEKGDSDTLKVEDSGFTFEDGLAYCGFRIKNKSDGIINDAISIRVTAKSSSGKILGTGGDSMFVSLKKGEHMVYSHMLSCEKKPAKVTLEILDESGEYTDIDNLKVENTHFSKKEYSSSVTGEVNNTMNKEYESVHIDVIFKNKKGKIIGGLDTYLEKAKAKSKAAFSVDCYNGFGNNNYEVYAIGYNY